MSINFFMKINKGTLGEIRCVATLAIALTIAIVAVAQSSGLKSSTLNSKLGISVKKSDSSGFVFSSVGGGFSASKNTLYIINCDIDLSGKTLTLPAGAVLKFEGGVIYNGTICGKGGAIEAPAMPIFDAIKIQGSFACDFLVEWWGAASVPGFDSAPAINRAILSGAKSIVARGSEYNVASPIVISVASATESLVFGGDVVALGGATAFEISKNDLVLKAVRIKSAVTADKAESNSGLLLTGSCFHCDFYIDEIENFGKGINLCPRFKGNRASAQRYGGIQYCKFTFQRLVNKENIVFDLSIDRKNEHVWISECQFFGGRIGADYAQGTTPYCRYGVVYKAPKTNVYNSADPICGLVFYSVGFEGLEIPFYGLENWCNCNFRDLRMSESIKSPRVIYMKNCKGMYFSIKSDLAGHYYNTTNNICFGEKNTIVVDKACTDIVVEDPHRFLYVSDGEVSSVDKKNLFRGR